MRIIIALCSLFLISCGSTKEFRKNMKLVDSAPVVKSFKNVVEGVNNSYFEIKENNYFDSYRLLFDSVKNTRYAGTYSIIAGSDSIVLDFYQKKGVQMLGNKALIKGNSITFFK